MNQVVKICGLRRAEDAARAVALGAEFLGIVLAPDSPRCASLDQALAVRDAVGSATPVVLVFRGADRDTVLRAYDVLAVGTVQVHGMPERDCARLEDEGLDVIRVHPVMPGARSLPKLLHEPWSARYHLLDVGRGGTGTAFDWSLLGDEGPEFTFVAGGITPDNVGELLAHDPWGIDVSSGIESAPGEKDHDELKRLFAALNEA